MKETIEEAAERWVFDTNGHKWSNNDDTAGDNYGSFIAGYKLAQERGYSGEEVIDLLYKRSIYQDHFESDAEVREWFEKFKKK
jgi:hypothetical protein